MKLPKEITESASFSGGEYAWKPGEFLDILKKASSFALVCDGGQFQFRTLNGATREMYWLSIDPQPRYPKEVWSDYVARREEEVRNGFIDLMHKIDFRKQGADWDFTEEKKIDPNFDPVRFLYFVSYFSSEDEKPCTK